MSKIEELKEYIEFLSKTDIEELEITSVDGEKISLKRSELLAYSEQLSKDKEEKQQTQEIPESQIEKKEFVITSPMVGRFLLSPSKDHPPFIVEGAQVKQGQKLAIIETMRIFRNVISPKNGIVKKILIEDGKYVEFGQPLIILEEI